MSRPAGEPLTPISIRIPTRELEIIRRRFPNGYQLKLRELIVAWVKVLEGEETLETLERMYP